MAKYIKNAFAVNGDRQPVPDDAQPSGQVSYQSGYTPDYALPKTDPNRKSIGRQPWNQLFNDVTANIKEWQDYGYPEFVSDDGTGSQLSYDYGRVVHLAGVLYRALIDGTSTTPPSAEWELYDPAHDVNALLSYAVSQLANGDSSKVGLLIDGTVVDALDYVVYPPELTIWATNGATGTSDGTLNTGTGAAGGVTGTLTIVRFSDATENATDLSGDAVTGTATFTALTNNIQLSGVGVNREPGDVVTITGTVSNNKTHTIESVTDDDNVIVNEAHANGAGSLSLTDETVTATVTLLAKWFHAADGLGQAWVDVTDARVQSTDYSTPPNRSMRVSITGVATSSVQSISSEGLLVVISDGVDSDRNTMSTTINRNKTLSAFNIGSSGFVWLENR